MHELADRIVANIHTVLTVMTLTMVLVALVYVLAWDRRLLRSPVSKLVLSGTAATCLLSVIVGLTKQRYVGRPMALSWIEHLGPELLGCVMVAATGYLTTVLLRERLPEMVRRFPRLCSFVRSAPAGLAAGWLLGALVLALAPAPTVSVAGDLAPWAFGYRAVVQLPALVYAGAMCVLPLLVLRALGEPKNETQLALKRRFAPLAAGGACWCVLWVNHLAWPFVGVFWSDSGPGHDHYYWYMEAMMPPILTALFAAYMVMLLRPYRPSGLALIERYGDLTTRLSFLASDLVGDNWMLRYRFRNARRLINLASEELGLPEEDLGKAIDTYRLVAAAKAGGDGAAGPPSGNRPLTREDLEELSRLHGRFVARRFCPRTMKPSTLDNRYAALIPDALLLMDRPSPKEMAARPLHLQLVAAAAADAGLLPAERDREVESGTSPAVAPRVLRAFERAKDRTDRSRRASGPNARPNFPRGPAPERRLR